MLLDSYRRVEAIKRQARRDYWIGVAALAVLALMQVAFLVAAWRLFSPP